ncbi:T9SS type A sorting domain-containing protein [Flavobacterium sp. NG2]|uniref:T9SS type A sorting domain-containing protein n=1 Tax=Flavobacterium sp. NG2 TaxID=3097547 RepID=UPI002A8104E0|nr:T9SS type A sorting domain-containing protein [Flavobacterium sp. NG2]WPR73127.1 T9SS type A sorting domain-containing protein [Flavobacterium sp. NG2]
MKRITLLLVLICATTFAQDVAPTFSWTNQGSYKYNGESNVTFKPGDVVSITLNYTLGSTGGVANTLDFILCGLQDEAMANVDPDTGTWANVPAPGATFAYPGGGTGGVVTFNYTIPAGTVLNSADANLTYRMLIYLAYKKGGGATTYGGPNANAIKLTKIRSAAEISTLGTADFSKQKLSSFYPNPVKDIITIGSDVETKTYKVLSLTGAVLKEVPATGTLNVSDLASGTYILSTDAGNAKIIKE